MASTNSSSELEVRDNKLHAHLWCAVAHTIFLWCAYCNGEMPRTDIKQCGQKEPDYSIYLGIAALWTNKEKLKEAKLLMGLPDTQFKITESEV